MPKPNNTSVTYTGTAGAGMTAYVTDLGCWGFEVGAQDNWCEWRETRRYKVMGPSERYDATIALNANGYGVNGSSPTVGALILGKHVRVLDKAASDKHHPTLPGYVCEVIYERPPMGIWGDTQPLSRPIVVNYSFSFMRVPTERDSQDYLVVNSAGDPFDPPQTIDVAILRVRIMKWLSSFSLSNAQSLVGKVNSASVTLTNTLGTCDARTLKCLNYAPANDIIPGAGYVLTIFEFEQRLESYDRNIIDKGFRAWYTDGSTKRKGKLAGTQDPTTPVPQAVLLAGDGTPLLPTHLSILDPKNGFSSFSAPAASQLPAYLTAVQGADTAGGYYLPYRIEPEASFAPFALLGL
jgi:hypothetical protein